MPAYSFRAKKGPEEFIEGVVQADSRADALAKLSAKGYIPISIDEKADFGRGLVSEDRVLASSKIRVPQRQLNILTRQFASLVRSGVPLLRALNILADQSSSKALQEVLNTIAESVRKGETLSESLKLFPKSFSPMFISLVHAGEIGGMLDVVMDRLAAKADRDDHLHGKVQGALAYPAFVGVTGIATVLFLLSFVMPRLLKMFESFGQQLPLPTRWLLKTSHAMSTPYFWVVFVFVAVLVIIVWYMPGSLIKRAWQRSVYRLPVFGDLVLQIEMARFTRSFGLLLEHGVNVLEAIEIAISVVQNPVIYEQLSKMPKLIEQGASLAKAFQQVDVVSSFIVNTVAVGEEGGKAGEALMEIASFHEREIERTLEVAAALLEPIMVLGVGALVGWIVMAVLLPVFELGSIM